MSLLLSHLLRHLVRLLLLNLRYSWDRPWFVIYFVKVLIWLWWWSYDQGLSGTLQRLRLDYNWNRVFSNELWLSSLHIHVFNNKLLSLLRHNCIDIILEVVVYMILVLLRAIRNSRPLNFGKVIICVTWFEIIDIVCKCIRYLWGHHLLLRKLFLKITPMLLTTCASIHIIDFLRAAWLHKCVWLELSGSRLQRSLWSPDTLRRVLRLLVLLLILLMSLWVAHPAIRQLFWAGHVYLIILLHIWLIGHLLGTMLIHHPLSTSSSL